MKDWGRIVAHKIDRQRCKIKYEALTGVVGFLELVVDEIDLVAADDFKLWDNIVLRAQVHNVLGCLGRDLIVK